MTEENQSINKVLIAGTKSTATKASRLKFESCTLKSLPLLDTFTLKNIEFLDKKYEWLIFTSPAAAKHFHSLTNKPAFSKVAVIGPSTGKRAESLGMKIDFIPENYNAESFSRELSEVINVNATILFPCSTLADGLLEANLHKQKIAIERVNLYEPLKLPKPVLPDFDSIAFLSGSSASIFKEYFGLEALKGKKIAAIGTKTAKTVNDLFGIQPLIPEESTAKETIKKLL